jgi:uncharacterized protein (DUF2141 family)
MPSNSKRIAAALATAVLFVGGAWVSSQVTTDISVATASSTGAQSDHGLVINLHGARSDTGNLIVMAFDQQEPFDMMDIQRAASYVELPATTGSQRVDFPELNNAYYSVIAFHDENGDYQLNYDADGLPVEGYAISGMNDLESDPIFYYSLIEPGQGVDLSFYYW